MAQALVHALDAARCRKRDLHPRKAGDEDAAYLGASLLAPCCPCSFGSPQLSETGHSGGRGYLLQLGQSLHLTQLIATVSSSTGPKCIFGRLAMSCVQHVPVKGQTLNMTLEEMNPFRTKH